MKRRQASVPFDVKRKGSRFYVFFSLVGVVAILLAGCGSPESTPTPTPTTSEPTAPTEGFEAEWQALLRAAQDEGTVHLVGGRSASRAMAPVFDYFEEQYGIEVRFSAGGGSANFERIAAEREAGRYTEDLNFTGARTGERMIEAGFMTPIEPLLIHPKVTDQSLWYRDRWAWSDVDQAYGFNFAANVQQAITSIGMNTDNVDPTLIESAFDLLDPRWRLGVSPPTDPSGQTSWVQAWLNEEIGPDWVRGLIEAENATFFDEDRIMAEQLARGELDFTFFSSTVIDTIEADKEAGVPIPAEEYLAGFVERGLLSGTGSSSNIYAIDSPPHPNAAKFFLNWFLTVEGQTAMHELVVDGNPVPTLRDDVTEWGNTLPQERREPGRTDYPFFSADPEFVEQIAPILEGEIMPLYQERQANQ